MNTTIRRISMVLAAVILVSCLAVCVYAQDVIKSGIGFVTASALRLRSGPSTDTETIDIAHNGDAIVVIDSEGDWYHVIFNLQEGYMHSAYLSVLDRENAELGYGEVNGYYVNLRTGPSTDYESCNQANEGSRVYIIGLNCGWYKVIYENEISYIRSDYVDLTEIPYENYASDKEPQFFRGGYSIGQIPTGDSVSSESDDYSDSSSESDSGYGSGYISAGQEIVDNAMQYLGVPYVWGGSSPSGFDCSGFAQYVMRSCGYTVGRGTDSQYFEGDGEYIDKADLVPGDMVFFAGTYDTDGTSHVGIYIGGGEFIHSSSVGCVTISELGSEYYTEHYYGARRVF